MLLDVCAGCLFELLGLRRSEPDRPGRGPDWFDGRAGDGAAWGLEDILVSSKPRASRMLPSPVGEGNWVSLNSVEADSMLLWRSSKLTEGRKSNDALGSFN